MERITRRGFMGMIVGGLTATKVGLGKSKDEQQRTGINGMIKPRPTFTSEDEAYRHAQIKVSEIKAESISHTKYNLIDDLVEEMYKNDEKHPKQLFRYFIHCNLSGLGWLDACGQLEKGMHKPNLMRGYRYVLWIPLTLEISKGVNVGMDRTQKADIFLLCCPEGCCKEFHIRHYELVTQRCFNIDRTKEGQALMEKVK